MFEGFKLYFLSIYKESIKCLRVSVTCDVDIFKTPYLIS